MLSSAFTKHTADTQYEQSLPVGAVWVISMTLSKHGDKQICSISRYLSTVSLRLQMDYPNTWISWFTRQLDLELKFSSIISLRTPKWNKWTELFTDLFALSLSSTYSLALFIRFGGFFVWIYLLALFIGFIYSLALFISFGGFIYLPYLWALVWTYTVFILIAISVSFSHISERNTFTFLSIYISQVLMEKFFRFPLPHHSYLIQLTLLQLHRHTSLIKLTNEHYIITSHPLHVLIN